MKKLFLQSGKLMIGEFPEEPEENWTGNNTPHQDDVHEEWQKYHDSVESAKESAVEVVNRIDFEFALGNIPQEGQLYDLPSGWTVEYGCDEPCIKARRCLIADHGNNDNCAQLHGNICQKKKRIARLVPVRAENAQGEIRKLIEGDIPPKYPSWANVTPEEYHDAVAAITEAQRRALIDEGAPQKGIIITDNPEEVGQIYDFNQDVTGDKEYGTELSLCETESELWNDVLLKTDDPRRNYNKDQSLIKELSENFTITRKKP